MSKIFQVARQASQHPILSYINTDILLVDDYLSAVNLVCATLPRFLVVGNRWDVEINELAAIGPEWRHGLDQGIRSIGRRHSPMGSDYFIFGRELFTDIPPFALGRSGWDNWMMYQARAEGIPLVDASAAITAIHQAHDYAHLPGGKPHYRHPESMANIKLAGGYEAMFRLRDADWLLFPERVRLKRFSEWDWPRKIEADLIATLKTGTRAKLIRMVFHPGDAFAYLRQKLKRATEIADPSFPGGDQL